jgi:hypothetical protein
VALTNAIARADVTDLKVSPVHPQGVQWTQEETQTLCEVLEHGLTEEEHANFYDRAGSLENSVVSKCVAACTRRSKKAVRAKLTQMRAAHLGLPNLNHAQYRGQDNTLISLTRRMGARLASALMRRVNESSKALTWRVIMARHVQLNVDKDITNDAIARHEEEHPECKSEALNAVDEEEEEEVTAKQRRLPHRPAGSLCFKEAAARESQVPAGCARR